MTDENDSEKKAITNPLIGVLDHGFVRLVDSMGNDLSVVRSARVSYNADWRKETDETSKDGLSKDEKLISYLIRNRHTSPFESVVFTFEIKCPIFVLRQWGRHRTQEYNDGAGIGYEKFWSYNEVSARYTELPEEFYIPSLEQLRTQAKDNKQSRSSTVVLEPETIAYKMDVHSIHSYELYKEFLACGLAREIARIVLPFNIYTRLFATVNLHNLFQWLALRMHPHAQYEIRVYADAVFNLVHLICPVSCKYFMESIHGV